MDTPAWLWGLRFGRWREGGNAGKIPFLFLSALLVLVPVIAIETRVTISSIVWGESKRTLFHPTRGRSEV